MLRLRNQRTLVIAGLLLVAMVFTSIKYVRAVGPDSKQATDLSTALSQGTASTSAVTCCKIPGDANGDGIVNYDDEILLIARTFALNVPPLPCDEQGDADGSGSINSVDISFLQRWFWIDSAAVSPPVCPL